jgi:alpha-L-arabinofuranosidase
MSADAYSANALVIDPEPLFELSPYRYMQFMEPLGATDGSVAAGWDDLADAWREDLVAATRELAPTMVRWGGCLSSYYRWREGVGPREARIPMLNLLWGGVETNQVGTDEFVQFCRQVGAEPLLSVNFASDGRQRWAHPPRGGTRSAGPEEAAAWVAYCNAADDPLRVAHGRPEPYGVRFWQIGNETSYDRQGYGLETAAERTLAFARAMRGVDPSIALIGWGDNQWAPRMLEVAGSELDYVAFHQMFRLDDPERPFDWRTWRRDPGRAWELLMGAHERVDARIRLIRPEVEGSGVPLALTESHLSLPGRNRNEVLTTWAAGVAAARVLNVHARHGDLLHIATFADFCGTRWTVNAVMIPMPPGSGRSYLMPVAQVMALYRQHEGAQALRVTRSPHGLDVTASRTGDRLYLHIANPSSNTPALVEPLVAGHRLGLARAWELAADPTDEVQMEEPGRWGPVERALEPGAWRVPPAGVVAIEAQLAAAPS